MEKPSFKRMLFFLGVAFFVLDGFLLFALIFGEHFVPQTFFASLDAFSQRKNFPEVAYLAKHQFDFKGYSNFFRDLVEEKGSLYAYQVLKRAPLASGTDLHLLGHLVSDEIYKKYGVEGIQYCDQDFRNACPHAIVVGLLLEKGESGLEEIAGACRRAPGGKGAYTMCFHGLGHGVLAFHGYDFEKAVETCTKTGTAAYVYRESAECIGGAVMEIVGGGFHDKKQWSTQRTRYLSKDNPLEICLAPFVPKEAVPMCFTYLTPYFFEVSGGTMGNLMPRDFVRAFAFCDLLPETDLGNKEACFGGFGKEFVVLAKSRDIRNIEKMSDAELLRVSDWCFLSPREMSARACISSSLNSFYWGGENKSEVAIRFCALLADPFFQSQCFESLIWNVSFYKEGQEERAEFCKKLPSAYEKQCEEQLLSLRSPDSYARTIFDKCSSAKYRPACYDEEIPKLLERLSMEEVFEATKLIQKQDDGYWYCHVLGHNVSAAETKKDPSKWRDVVARCPGGMCSNGCIHGAFQERFRQESLSFEEAEQLLPDLTDICEARSNWHPTRMEQATCYHALGHLMMYITGGEIRHATDFCEQVAKKSAGRDYSRLCFDGAFMQIFQPLEPEDVALVKGKQPSRESVRELCWNFTGAKRSSCWSEAWPLFREEILTPGGLFDFCSVFDASPEKKRCLLALFYVVTPQMNFDIQRLSGFCAKIPQDARGQCFANAASRIIETDYSLVPKSLELCKKAQEFGVENECYDELIFYSTYNFKPGSAEALRVCAGLPYPWGETCTQKNVTP